MLYKSGNKIGGVYFNNKVITKIYHGANLVWQLIKSCFGAGYWISVNPWLGSDAWKENKN
jgi:hypothetical protein